MAKLKPTNPREFNQPETTAGCQNTTSFLLGLLLLFAIVDRLTLLDAVVVDVAVDVYIVPVTTNAVTLNVLMLLWNGSEQPNHVYISFDCGFHKCSEEVPVTTITTTVQQELPLQLL